MNELSTISADPAASGSYWGDDEIEADISRFSYWSYVAIAALFVALILAATLIPIGGAVIGSGSIGAESRVKRIAHPTGGVISEIYVREGDRVKKGDLLMRLDTRVSGVNADLSGQTVDQLLAQRARLTAEREGRASISFPAELLSRGDASAQQAIAAERRLMSLRLNERRGSYSQLVERVRQLQSQIESYRAQIDALQKQKSLIEPERKGVDDLWNKGLVTINRRNQMERTAADMDGSIASLQANIAQTQARISETREQMISIDQTARSEAGTQLAQVNAALNEQQVRNVSADDQLDRSAIRAPYDGYVDKLAFATIGGVVQPAETIMEIVPAKDNLLVEAAVRPADIDQLRLGQDARVRLSAFSNTATPEIPGKLVFISPERTTDPNTQATYYRVRVTMDGRALNAEGLKLKPGMPAEVFISTNSRSMISYITKPLRDQFERAFRD